MSINLAKMYRFHGFCCIFMQENSAVNVESCLLLHDKSGETSLLDPAVKRCLLTPFTTCFAVYGESYHSCFLPFLQKKMYFLYMATNQNLEEQTTSKLVRQTFTICFSQTCLNGLLDWILVHQKVSSTSALAAHNGQWDQYELLHRPTVSITMAHGGDVASTTLGRLWLLTVLQVLITAG